MKKEKKRKEDIRGKGNEDRKKKREGREMKIKRKIEGRKGKKEEKRSKC